MRIDWFILVAQIINFLVLVWLLKRFLYGRIIEAMNNREVKIAARLDDAARRRADADQEATRLQTRNCEWEKQRAERLAAVEKEADEHHQRLLEASRREIAEAREQWLESLRRERQTVLEELRERLGLQAMTVARRALSELADTELEQQIAQSFVRRLQSLASQERDAIAVALQNADHEVQVRTAFSFPPDEQERLTQVLREQLGERVNVVYATAPGLVCGVELHADSHRLVWNFGSYLEGLEDRVFAVLEEKGDQHAQSS